MTTAVTEAWEQIAAEGRPEAGWHARRLNPASVTPLHAALHQPGGSKAILLEVRARAIHPANSFPTSSGFEVTVEPLLPGPNGSVRVCLRLTDPRFADVFAVFAEDIVGSVSAAASETEGVLTLIGRLNTWQRFLKKHADRALTEQERVGLFAELLVLERLLESGLSAADATAAWRGPWGGAQDFALPACSIEVKASTSGNPASFEVSNLAQLDDRLLPNLILRHVMLARQPGVGRSLPGLVDDIRSTLARLDAAAVRSFEDCLLEVGYVDAHRTEYETEIYRPALVRSFRVRAGFPRIISNDVCAGISACSYSVELSACLPFLIDEPAANLLISGGINE